MKVTWLDLVLVVLILSLFPVTGRLWVIWWLLCWTPWSRSRLCCCCSSSSSSSSVCSACSSSAESSTSTRPLPNEALLTTSLKPCWLCFRCVCVCVYLKNMVWLIVLCYSFKVPWDSLQIRIRMNTIIINDHLWSFIVQISMIMNLKAACIIIQETLLGGAHAH